MPCQRCAGFSCRGDLTLSKVALLDRAGMCLMDEKPQAGSPEIYKYGAEKYKYGALGPLVPGRAHRTY